jgi:hypothetical protein
MHWIEHVEGLILIMAPIIGIIIVVIDFSFTNLLLLLILLMEWKKANGAL